MSSPTTLVATRPNEKKGGAMANSSPDLPKPLRGITLDSIENLNQSLNLIKSSSQKLTVRVVMDSDESLDNYGKAVEALHPHAYVITNDDGHSVLVHLGLDTVSLGGKGFTLLASEGDTIDAGSPVISWSPAQIEAGGLNPIVPVIALEGDETDLEPVSPRRLMAARGTRPPRVG